MRPAYFEDADPDPGGAATPAHIGAHGRDNGPRRRVGYLTLIEDFHSQDTQIRRYADSDAIRVGVLIADTYGGLNLHAMTPTKRESMLGPFALAGSSMPADREAIAAAISAPSVWVAEHEDDIVGVLRGGRTDRRGRTVLSSLFVNAQYHRQGVGRKLVERFEQEYAAKGAEVFRLSATLYSVPFYLSMGYKRSTGERTMSSFGEPGLTYQPMTKAQPQQH